MIPQKVTIGQLFSMPIRYLVPIFQRQYVWSEEDQWSPLWDDVVHKAQEVSSSSYLRQPRAHFMGAVVVKGIAPSGLAYQSYEVIDGQQRLTTLQILLIALRDYTKTRDLPHLAQHLTTMTGNPYLVGTEYEQWKVLPTTRDRVAYKNVWDSGTPEELLVQYPRVKIKYSKKYAPQPRLVAAYLFFEAAIRRFAETNDDFDDDAPAIDATVTNRRVEALLQAITQQLELVRIDLDPDDDPQIIFETLNARGVRLLPGDLVRNFMFLEATRQYKTQARVQKLYEAYWLPYDEGKSAEFWKENVRQGRLMNLRFELFLFHFLTSQIKRHDEDIQLAHLYRAFGDWWNEAPGSTRDVETALQLIERYSVFYKRLFSSDDTDRVAVFGRRLRIMDNSTIYPLLLFLFVERAEDTINDVEGIVEDLESYLVRRLLCGLTPKSYNRTFVRMLVELRREQVITREAVQHHLLNLTGPTAEWPTDEQFHDHWMTSKVYENLRQNRVVMVLEALEWTYYGAKQEQKHPPSGTAYSVEHILPQHPATDAWPLRLPQGATDEEHQNALLTRETLMHTFGNLTLVTAPMNSALSNGPFESKRLLLHHSTLMLNKYFGQPHIVDWNETRIRERGQRLFNVAKMIWKRPAHIS